MEKEEFLAFKNKFDNTGATLVAVSKKKSVADVRKIYGFGQRDFGENYVQELVSKYQALPDDIRWHFIGHLQRNKVREIAPFVYLIHSVDTERLIREIDKQAIHANRVIPVLLQVHIAREETKFGFSPDEIKDVLPRLHLYPNVVVKGLMGMATLTENHGQVENEFRTLKDLFEQCKTEHAAADWKVLSMGMSGDYEMALQEGSTMVRIGTLIFGKREY